MSASRLRLPSIGNFLHAVPQIHRRYTHVAWIDLLRKGAGKTGRLNALLKRHHDLGFTCFHLGVYNQPGHGNRGDYVSQGVRVTLDCYHNATDYGLLMDALALCRRHALDPVIWLRQDDHDGWDADSAFDLLAWWEDFLPTVSDQCAAFVPGLEMNEYWHGDVQLDLAKRVLELTKPETMVVPHWTRNVWGGYDDAEEEWWGEFSYREKVRLIGGLQFKPTSEAEFQDMARDYVRAGKRVGVRMGYAEGENTPQPGRGQMALDAGLVLAWTGL